jgi:SAM-dependent methyltransferase
VERVVADFRLTPQSLVIEIGSNDGYLLQYFLKQGIPVLGIEPAANVARVAEAKGIPSLVEFFGSGLARQLVAAGKAADLIIGNNVLAHVPGLNDFVAGLKLLLKPRGWLTLEFPHLLRLIAENQFDTIYHEHFSYFSFITVEKVFAAHGLRLFDVEELPTHGGSLRIFGCHAEDAGKPATARVAELKQREERYGLNRLETYRDFAGLVKKTKRRLLNFLIQAKEEGKNLVGYGAPAKGNTLLNYCGIRGDFLDYTVDRSPHKQGLFLPGTHIPIESPDRVRQTKPDYLFILPWNIKEEIMEQMACIREWGGKFVVPIPEVRIYE